MSDLSSDVVTDVPLYAQPEVHQRRWTLLAVLCLSLVMDGDAGGVPVCFNPASGQRVPPGQRTTVRVGYDSANDPTRAELLVETNGPPVPLVAAPS